MMQYIILKSIIKLKLLILCMFMFKMLKQPTEVFYKKSVFRVFVKFTEKQVC